MRESCQVNNCAIPCSHGGDTCGTLDYRTGPCRTCAHTSCCAETGPCASDAECAGLHLCAMSCAGDAGCVADCLATASPEALTLFETLDTCRSSNCATECAAF